MARFAGPQWLALGLTALIIVADQVSKAWVFRYLAAGGRRMVEVLPVFNLVALWNRGVSFGAFNGGSGPGSFVFVGLALAIVVVLAVWLQRTERRLPAAGLGLIIGGALGNVIDRARIGAVFDFIDLHAFGWHFWAFNVADSAITVGVILLLLDSLFGGAEQSKR